MPKVIENINLLKKLQEYIDFETEYNVHIIDITKPISDTEDVKIGETCLRIKSDLIDEEDYNLKTLTTDEAIELLPEYIDNVEWGGQCDDGELWYREADRIYFLFLKETRSEEEGVIYKIKIMNWGSATDELDLVIAKTPIEVYGNILNYLIDNNLLNKKDKGKK